MSKKTPRRSKPHATVRDFCDAMEQIAPTGLAQSWDNVGLIAGDMTAPLRKVLLCIDLTPAVFKEAKSKHADLVLAYHPPIFTPIKRLQSPGASTEAIVFDCIRAGIAIYSTHTALDVADGGTNDVLAALSGIKKTEPLEYVDTPGDSVCKLIVFVTTAQADKVAAAMFAEGAGRIGDYDRCSFRSMGTGTFHGGTSTKPIVGKPGSDETIAEVRIETVVPTNVLPAVVSAMVRAHPYDEPAFDIYPLKPAPVRGIGRIGSLPTGTTLSKLARKLKRATSSSVVQTIGKLDQSISRAIIVAGAAGSLPFQMKLIKSDVIVTGEIRHHDALTINRLSCTAIALGHWSSERPALQSLADRLTVNIHGLTCQLSDSDAEPFMTV